MSMYVSFLFSFLLLFYFPILLFWKAASSTGSDLFWQPAIFTNLSFFSCFNGHRIVVVAQ